MTIWKPLRILFIKSSNLTHGFQNEETKKVIGFYKLWAPCYDFTVRIDPAYPRELKKMVRSVVRPGDVTLDIGCGTGLSTIYAASIAKKVVGVDPSPDMTRKLTKKIQKRNIENIEIKNGYFPEALAHGEKFDSVISSFMLAHFVPKQRAQLIVEIFDRLNSGGRLGLFSAQGEVASTFERRKETVNNLSLAGFQDIDVRDVSDVYRISTARKQ